MDNPWIPLLREKDVETDWGYHRVPSFKKPQVNDLVIFKSPENKEILLVKRITKRLPRESELTVNTSNYDNYKKIIRDEENRVELRNGSVWINGVQDSVYQLKNDDKARTGRTKRLSDEEKKELFSL